MDFFHFCLIAAGYDIICMVHEQINLRHMVFIIHHTTAPYSYALGRGRSSPGPGCPLTMLGFPLSFKLQIEQWLAGRPRQAAGLNVATAKKWAFSAGSQLKVNFWQTIILIDRLIHLPLIKSGQKTIDSCQYTTQIYSEILSGEYSKTF